MKKYFSILAILIIVGLGILVYANSLGNPFIWDDQVLIVKNDIIKDFANLPKVFTSALISDKYSEAHFYRPMQTLSNMLDYRIWGLNPFGYHVTNLLFHILNAILIFFLIVAISGNRTISIITSLLFVIHPIHTEAVTYISGRADILATFFLLLASILFIKCLQHSHMKRALLYTFSLLCFFAAILSKESSIIFPLILAAYLFIFPATKLHNRYKIKSLFYLLPFFILVVAYFLLRSAVLKSGASSIKIISPTSMYPWFLTMCGVLATYIRLLFLPVGLHMERLVPIIKSAFRIDFIIPIVFLVTLLVLWVKLSRRNKFVLFGMLWFFIALLPLFGVIKLNALIAEHWLYFPSIGFFMTIGYCAFMLFENNVLKISKGVYIGILTTLFVMILGIYSVLTVMRNIDWSNPIYFYQSTLKYTPQSPRLYYNLALVYVDNKQFDEALENFKKAVELKLNHEEAYNYLGNIYSMKGSYDKAKEAFEKSLQINPDSSKAHNGLGIIYDETGQYDQAIDEYQKALKTEPENAKTHCNLANAYAQKGLFEMSIEEFNKSLATEPRNYTTLYNIGVIYYQRKMFDESICYLKKALEIEPNLKSAHKLIKDMSK